MISTKIVKVDLDSPRQDFSNGGLGIFVALSFSGNCFFACSYWRSNPDVG